MYSFELDFKTYGFCAKAILDLPHFQENMLNKSQGLTVNL